MMMIRKYFIQIVSFTIKPLPFSVVVSVIIILLFLPPFPKYKVEIIEQKQAKYTEIICFEDLDNNGYGDRIQTTTYENGLTCVTVNFEPSLFFQEWDLPGGYSFTLDTYLLTGDFDGNNMKELYVFTIANDSILLNIISDLKNKHPRYKTKFIDRVGENSKIPHLAIVKGEMDDLNGDGYKELIFAVNAGFSISPRTVYAFDIQNDTLLKSPRGGYFIDKLVQADLTGDGKDEIIVNGYASQNIKDPAIIMDDSCCWLIILNRKLQHLFPPVEFRKMGYSNLTTVAIPNANNYYDIYSLYIPPMAYKEKNVLYHFDTTGTILKKKEVIGCSNDQFSGVYTYLKKQKNIIAFRASGDKILLYDTNFILFDELPFQTAFSNVWPMDIDNDDQKELVGLDYSQGKCTIYRSDLSEPVSIELNYDIKVRTSVSLKEIPGQRSEIFIDSGDIYTSIAYMKNPMFYGRWGIYTGIFLAIYLFTMLIWKIQRIQLQKKYDTEKKITELQMKIVRNQMDPHFTMNAVNSVIAAINQNEKEEATQHLLQFSKMYRHLVLTADKIKCTLAEELDFTQNYLAMEQFRFSDKFSFEVNIEPDVNLSWEVPKMVIQSPVENAIKHGLLNLPGKGHLNISAKTIGSHLILGITDNGIGRKKASGLPGKSTGKGMKAMEEFLRLYQKTTGIKVETAVEDLSDPEGKPAGTKVVITIEVLKLEARIGS